MERQIALRDGKAAVVVADVIVRRQSRAEDGAADLHLETCRARIRRDSRIRVDRLRDGGNRIAVDEAARLDAEGARAVHIGRRIVRRTVDAALVACSERQRTLRDAERAGGVGDRVVASRTSGEVGAPDFRLEPRRARVRRDERVRVDRLRDVVDGIAVDEPRRRRRRTDVDLARAVHVVCRRVGIAVDAALVARRDREGARLDRQSAGGRRDLVVRIKAVASFCQLRSLQRHRVVITDARALRDGIGAVLRHDRVLGKAVASDERAGVRRRGAHDDRVVRRAVDALAVRRREVDLARLDRQSARFVFEVVVGRLERAVRDVRHVLARMERTLREARRVLRVRNRGIENRPRRPGVRDRLIVCEVLERDAVVARIVLCIAVVGLRLRLAANRDRARHDAVVDLDFVVEFVVTLVGDLLIGDRRFRAVGMRTRAHPDVGHRVLHRAVL